MATRKKIPLIPTDATFTIAAAKTLSTSVNFDVSGADIAVVGSGTAVITFPSATSTLATLTLTEALTNKTYNGNTFTAGTGTITITGTKTLTVADTASVSGTNTGDNAANSTITIATAETNSSITPAADGTYASPTSITIVKGIITAIS